MALRGEVGRGVVLLVVVSTLTGFLTGLASLALALTVTGFNDGLLRATNRLSPALLIAAPAAGGVVSGLIAEYVAGEVRGHGTDAVIRAILLKEGFIRARAPLAKLAATVSTVGSGGSGGLVGPMVHIGAGISSALARAFGLGGRYVRVLALSGVSAGVSGVLKAPVAGALAGLEILYRGPGLERGALIPSLTASLASYLTVSALLGPHPLLYYVVEVPLTTTCSAGALLIAALIGVAGGAASRLYSQLFYGVRSGLERLKVHPALKPVVGAAASGVIAAAIPQVSGAGYGFLPPLILGEYTAVALLTLSMAKLAATCLTVGSGGSGGVVAPAILIGASLGASISKFLTPTLTNLPVPVSAVEGVVALLSGACRVPLAAVALSVEVTRCPAIIPLSILTALISYLIAGPGATIYRSQEGG